MTATWSWEGKVELMTSPDFLQRKPISEWINDCQYLCRLDLGEVPYDGSTAESQTQDLNTGSLCSAPGLTQISKITQTVPLSPCFKAFLFSLSSLQTIMEPVKFQFSTNPSRYQFCISSYHHNPFSFLKNFSCKLIQYFCLPVRPLFSPRRQWPVGQSCTQFLCCMPEQSATSSLLLSHVRVWSLSPAFRCKTLPSFYGAYSKCDCQEPEVSTLTPRQCFI